MPGTVRLVETRASDVDGRQTGSENGTAKRSKSRNKKNGPSLIEKSQTSSKHARSRASENYEEPVSERESWWRCTIKETPNPGSYESKYFLDDLHGRPNTYSFKSDGRKREAQPLAPKGSTLLPGAYNHRDFVKMLERDASSYGFKDTSRSKGDTLNFGKKDKDINVPPNNYETHNYMSMSVDKQPSKHWYFRSQSQRFPTIYFKPKEGPAPGLYENCPPTQPTPLRSSFSSRTPRFATSHTKVPGPGSYEKMYSPMTNSVLKMGRQHGLFFSPEFNA